MSTNRAATFRGIGASPGIAIGQVLVLESPGGPIFRVAIGPDQTPAEITRLHQALSECRRQIEEARDRALREAGEGYARVFDAHLLILEDPSLLRDTLEIIRRDEVNAEWALREVVARYLKRFPDRDDSILGERAADVEDVHTRIQLALSGGHHHDLSELQEDVIVVARVLAPSDLVLLNRDHVIGLAIEEGGQTSHTAIIANALSVPAVVGLKGLLSVVRSGDLLALDGRSGSVELRPGPEVLEECRRAAAQEREMDRNLLAERDLPTVTSDGLHILLLANLELPDEAGAAVKFGAEGVGLYRSEFLFLHRAPDLPTEEDHRKAYRALAEGVSPHGAVVRTLDLGGEKYFHRILERGEGNPVMGLRGIRFCLHRRDIFRTQLRGFLRAAAEGGLSLMFPMISDLDELIQAKQVLEETRRELRAEGSPVPVEFPLGVMIEVPAAAAIADLLAREVDFFSIGTNDLIQYALAIDRGNPSVAYLYRPLHPAILRLVKGVIDAARSAGIRVSLCGEMAADPLCAPLLVGMGLTELSMGPATLPAVKHMLRSLSAAEARDVAREAMSLSCSAEILEMLRRRLGSRLPSGLSWPVHSG